MKPYNIDMHIHTCLSACGDWGMSPRAVVEKCKEIGLDLIAISDHNSMENAEAAMRVGKRIGLSVLPGMEVCSREEVHILAIFDDLEQAQIMQEYVYKHLPGTNRPEFFGDQVVANEYDEVIHENSRLLNGATTLGISEIVDKTHGLGGLSIASHVDRPLYGLMNQLGFIPPDLPLDGVEVSYRMSIREAREKYPSIGDRACVTASDAHYLSDLGRARTIVMMKEPTFEEIRLTLQGKDGRRIL